MANTHAAEAVEVVGIDEVDCTTEVVLGLGELIASDVVGVALEDG